MLCKLEAKIVKIFSVEVSKLVQSYPKAMRISRTISVIVVNFIVLHYEFIISHNSFVCDFELRILAAHN
jgi:predicted dinucleotide-utilizing enzyme